MAQVSSREENFLMNTDREKVKTTALDGAVRCGFEGA
jgi:hypothetical protein